VFPARRIRIAGRLEPARGGRDRTAGRWLRRRSDDDPNEGRIRAVAATTAPRATVMFQSRLMHGRPRVRAAAVPRFARSRAGVALW